MLRWKAGKPVEPAFISVVNLKANSRKTACGPAIAFIKSYGLDVALDNEAFLSKAGLDETDLSVDDQESVYLTHDELKAEGYHSMMSANLAGVYSLEVVEDVFLHHPIFGMANRKSPVTDQNSGCDFCLWIIYVAKVGVNDNIIADTDIGPIAIELDCTYNPNDPVKATNCPKLVKSVKQKLVKKAKRLGERPHQYVNTPGCDDAFYSFGER
jgi:hypothetical protein